MSSYPEREIEHISTQFQIYGEILDNLIILKQGKIIG